MASKLELEALVVLGGKFDSTLIAAIKVAEKEVEQVKEKASLIEKAFGIAGKAVKGAATTIGTAMVAAGKKGIGLASELAEVQRVADATFGQGVGNINAWAQTTLKSFGLTELSAKQLSTDFALMLKGAGIGGNDLVRMSETVAGLSGDFASFFNLDPASAFEKIKAGISGDSGALQDLGIQMDAANLQAYALSKGITASYDTMSEAEQIGLRYGYLLDSTKDIQGDFLKTQDSFANQQRLLGQSFEQLSTTVMSAALPALVDMMQTLNGIVDRFMSDPENIRMLQVLIGGVADALATVLEGSVSVFKFIYDNWSLIEPLLIGIVAGFLLFKGASATITVFDSVSKAFSNTLKGLRWAFDRVRLAKIKDKLETLYLYSLYAKDAVVKGFTATLNGVRVALDMLRWSKIKDKLETLYLMSLYAKDAVIKAANTVATWGMVAAGAAWNVISAIGAGLTWALGAAIAFLTSPIGLIVLAVAALIGIFLLLYNNWDQVSAFLSSTWETIRNAFAVGINFIIDKINWLIEKINMIPGVEIPMIPKLETGAVNVASSAAPVQTPVLSGNHLTAYASGGFANRPSIFGEAGLEAAIPIKRTPRSLGLLNQTAQMLGVTGGGAGHQFVFAPNIVGGSGESLRSQLALAYEDFKEMCDRYFESKARESFG